MRVFAIDPGPKQSGVAEFDTDTGPVPGTLRVVTNEDVHNLIADTTADVMAFEMVQNYGMPVGDDVFETVLEMGGFRRTWEMWHNSKAHKVYRPQVRVHLCNTIRAKDKNINAVIMNRYGGKGTKKSPGVLYGMTNHSMSALAVGITFAESEKFESIRRETT